MKYTVCICEYLEACRGLQPLTQRSHNTSHDSKRVNVVRPFTRIHTDCITSHLTAIHIFNSNLSLLSVLCDQYEIFAHYSILVEDWEKQQVSRCLKSTDTSSRLGRFTPGERVSGTSWIGSCVGLIWLDTLKKRNISKWYRVSKEKSIRESFYVPRKMDRKLRTWRYTRI